MRQSPTIRAAALTGFGALARSYGLDPAALLRAAGLPADAERDPDRRLPTSAINRMFEQTAELAGADDFGLRLADLRGFSNLGPVTLLARDEPDIRSALAIFISYLPLHNEALTIDLSEHDGLAILACAVAGEGPKVQATDVAVAMLYRILRQLLGTGWQAQGIYLERQRPVRLGPFERAYSARVHFARTSAGLPLPRPIWTGPTSSPKRPCGPIPRSCALACPGWPICRWPNGSAACCAPCWRAGAVPRRWRRNGSAFPAGRWSGGWRAKAPRFTRCWTRCAAKWRVGN
jgi:hypothetical protein